MRECDFLFEKLFAKLNNSGLTGNSWWICVQQLRAAAQAFFHFRDRRRDDQAHDLRDGKPLLWLCPEKGDLIVQSDQGLV